MVMLIIKQLKCYPVSVAVVLVDADITLLAVEAGRSPEGTVEVEGTAAVASAKMTPARLHRHKTPV